MISKYTVFCSSPLITTTLILADLNVPHIVWWSLTGTEEKSQRMIIFFRKQLWAMQFNIEKCQAPQIRTKNTKYDYEMSGVKLKSVQCAKDLGVEISPDHNVMMQQIKRTECWVLSREIFHLGIKM